MLLMDAFLQNNRLDHVSRIMASHPSYLEHFLRTQHFILRGDGPLSYDYRHFIAIMVSICSHFCHSRQLTGCHFCRVLVVTSSRKISRVSLSDSLYHNPARLFSRPLSIELNRIEAAPSNRLVIISPFRARLYEITHRCFLGSYS